MLSSNRACAQGKHGGRRSKLPQVKDCLKINHTGLVRTGFTPSLQPIIIFAISVYFDLIECTQRSEGRSSEEQIALLAWKPKGLFFKFAVACYKCQKS